MKEIVPTTQNTPSGEIYPYTLLVSAGKPSGNGWGDDWKNCNELFRVYLKEEYPATVITNAAGVIMRKYVAADVIELSRYPNSDPWSREQGIRGITFYPDEQGAFTPQMILEHKSGGMGQLTPGSAGALAALVHSAFRAAGMPFEATSTG